MSTGNFFTDLLEQAREDQCRELLHPEPGVVNAVVMCGPNVRTACWTPERLQAQIAYCQLREALSGGQGAAADGGTEPDSLLTGNRFYWLVGIILLLAIGLSIFIA